MEIRGIKAFTQALVERHECGNPVHPATCSNVGQSFRYNDTDGLKPYSGNTCIIGLSISCAGAVQYAASVNKALDDGYTIDCGSASSHGSRLLVRIKKDRQNEPKAEVQTEANTSVPSVSETTHSNTAEDEVVEDAEATGDKDTAEETPVELSNTPTEELPETSEVESSEDGTSGSEINWDYAESIIKRDDLTKPLAKDILAEYALGFGIELRTTVGFEKMIKEFKAQVGTNGKG